MAAFGSSVARRIPQPGVQLRALTVVSALVAPGGLMAAPWEAFQTRCLHPMETGVAADVTGLNLLGTTTGTGQIEIAQFADPDGAYGFETVHRPGAGQFACSLSVTDPGFPGTGFLARFNAWTDSVLARGDYGARPTSNGALHALQTAGGRLPPLVVTLWYRDTPPMWVAVVRHADDDER